jgi:hypothetical protein
MLSTKHQETQQVQLIILSAQVGAYFLSSVPVMDES